MYYYRLLFLFLFIPGRILFELATCLQLDSEEVFPTMEHIEEITDDQLRNLLKYIFERSGTKISHSLEEVGQFFLLYVTTN